MPNHRRTYGGEGSFDLAKETVVGLTAPKEGCESESSRQSEEEAT